jgi:uncharacterized protein YndB with AHSA1/START domain
MKPIDMTDSSQTEAIAFEFDLPHPPAKVWRALTDPALLAEWLLPATNLHLELGAAFTLKAEPQPGWDGTVDCRVLHVEPQRKLSYEWIVGETLSTAVTFTLTPTERGTQSGFKPDQKRNFGGARYGWRMMGERLFDLLGRIS